MYKTIGFGLYKLLLCITFYVKKKKIKYIDNNKHKKKKININQRQSGQYQLPFGATVIPTQSK